MRPRGGPLLPCGAQLRRTQGDGCSDGRCAMGAAARLRTAAPRSRTATDTTRDSCTSWSFPSGSAGRGSSASTHSLRTRNWRHEQFSRCPSASPPTATAHFGNGPSGCSATSSPGSCFRTSARVLPFTCCRGTAPVCGPAPPSTAGAALHTYDAFTSTGADLCAFVSLPSATATATTCALSAAGAHHLRASAAARARLGGSK